MRIGRRLTVTYHARVHSLTHTHTDAVVIYATTGGVNCLLAFSAMQMSDVPLSLILTLLTLILFERFAKNLHQQPHAAEFLTPPLGKLAGRPIYFADVFSLFF